MIKNPIQKVPNELQYRAIGIVKGIYKPIEKDKLNRGTLVDHNGEKIETVVLGKALPLIRKYLDLNDSYFWIVYPKNKNTQNLHLQIAGIWDPNNLNEIANKNSKRNSLDLLGEFNLKDNYFSIRGEVVYVNTKKGEFVIKICFSPQSKKLRNNSFKLVIDGELSLDMLNNFLSLDVTREGSILRMQEYNVVKKIESKNNKSK